MTDRTIAMIAGRNVAAIVLLGAAMFMIGTTALFRIFRRLLISAVAAICIAAALMGFACREVRHHVEERIMLLRALKHP
jgi:glutamate synthase domain-containing protein 2